MDQFTTTMSVTTEGSSPWFSGHFPNNPILPGIAQLKMVADLLQGALSGELSITGFSRVKFRRIVRPGEQLDILVKGDCSENQHMFRITCGDEEVCSGKIFSIHKQQKERIHE